MTHLIASTQLSLSPLSPLTSGHKYAFECSRPDCRIAPFGDRPTRSDVRNGMW